MTVTSKPIITAKYAANAETTEYTAGTGVRTIVDKFTAYNSDTSARTLTVKLVPSGVAAGASHVIVAKTIEAGGTYPFPEVVGHVLEAGGAISVLGSVASKLVIRSSGREVTA
jgi:hypothetical protein